MPISQLMSPAAAIWLVSLASIALVLIRPKGLPEAWWAMIGACLLVLCRLISPLSAVRAVGKGLDVYLFLIGMMIMSELARREGVFDWVAGLAVRASNGSRARLFLLIYCVGIVVTVFLSNDATAVVLTPAVFAAVRAAKAEPLPYLLICAFIANAASFVLPISNPANLVVYSSGMPTLGRWLLTFGLPSLVSILMTFLVLRWFANKLLQGPVATNINGKPLSPDGKLTLYGIGFLAVTLMTASALNFDLGAPVFAVGLLVATAVSIRDHSAPKDVIKDVSWSVLPLVAGLFVIVEALTGAGALAAAVHALRDMQSWQPLRAALGSGFGVALISNLMNNLPSGLIAGMAVKASGATGPLRNALLIGVDLGPNFSVTGSLATILWLAAVRREGQEVGFWKFLKWGAFVTPPALALAILAVLLSPQN
ncbi:MAG TPA: arsenic transporter [Bryobacteraceae bacterium]|jgi:arsenical pump membrane protein|nr:arsenic transporter [Bryobacteraceae bacterium]